MCSKLNPSLKPSLKLDDVRLAGGSGAKAAKQSEIELLRRVVLANLLWEDVAYIDGKSVADEIKRLIPLCKGKDVANLALEARINQKLRHTPLFIAVEMCRYPEHKTYVKELLPMIITRADMLTDFLALYWKDGKKPICNQAKKGLAAAFHNFNEYKFAKYDRDAAIKLRDVMFLCRPKPNNEQEAELFKKIADRTLTPPETWEVLLSAGKDKKETWQYLINNGKIGGLAMLRNISNMMKANVDKEIIRYGLRSLKSSMLLPLDFFKSARMATEFKRDIEDAMIESYKSLPKLKGNTLFIVDVSGSMLSNLSGKSSFSRLDAACAMAMLAINQCERYELVTTAGDDYRRIQSSEHIKYPERGFGVFNQIKQSMGKIGSGGIFTKQCLDWCRKKFGGVKFDRIIIFSDSQDIDYHYDKTILPEPFGKCNYICDVSAELRGVNYKGRWTAEIGGFSEHFLTYIAALEGLQNKFEEQ
ncbi:TROVE domain-containing protein [uncultured phage cr106_1]|uniref:TROVE domain-containing protein n=1 Tax=uncultured phage cr106_1 TaxID=2772062 RepID=A0A7M1RZ53_9CAUD|nr:RNA-binding protein [uncultured phage cr106_1]QOR58300.1 TROVE domain-containing protein [uncultured phage cr106_1]